MDDRTTGQRNVGDYVDAWRPARLGLFAVLGFAALLALWSWTAPLSGAAIAEGNFEIEGRRQTVQHPYGGVIDSLAVDEGARVERGEVLITLSDVEPRAQYDVLIGSRHALLARKARLVAERDGMESPDFLAYLPDDTDDAAVSEILANESGLFAARKEQHDANADVIEQRIVQLNEQSTGIRAQIEGLERQAELIEEEAAGARQLVETGVAPRARIRELERDASELRSNLGLRRSEVASLHESMGESRLEIARLERDRLSEITERIQQVDSELAELAPRIEAATDVLRRTEILSPASGRVVGLSVFTEGGVIESGTRLLDIVPDSNPLFVEARLRPSDLSDVFDGQQADVRLLGTPRTVRPKLTGTITNISADSIADERSGERYYALQVTLQAEEVADAGMVLQPGMPVQVVIETQPRTLIGYLTSPLMDEVSGAFRER